MNFDQLKLNLQGEVTLNYGKFISTVINFLITAKVTIALLNLVSLANHGMRKTWCYVCGVYGGMFRKTNGDLDSLRFSYITES